MAWSLQDLCSQPRLATGPLPGKRRLGTSNEVSPSQSNIQRLETARREETELMWRPGRRHQEDRRQEGQPRNEEDREGWK